LRNVLINLPADPPGLTAAFTGILAGEVNILDIGQAVIHDTLSFGILVECRAGWIIGEMYSKGCCCF